MPSRSAPIAAFETPCARKCVLEGMEVLLVCATRSMRRTWLVIDGVEPGVRHGGEKAAMIAREGGEIAIAAAVEEIDAQRLIVCRERVEHRPFRREIAIQRRTVGPGGEDAMRTAQVPRGLDHQRVGAGRLAGCSRRVRPPA